MRSSLRALHALALGIWAGALVAIALGAVDLFQAARPVCPRCGLPFMVAPKGDVIPQPPARCDVCGARHHRSCLAPLRGPTCGFLDGGGFSTTPHPAAPVGSGALFARVSNVPPGGSAPRVLWRADRTTPALEARGVREGDVSALPFAAAGDAARRLFELARMLGLSLGAVALLSAFLTPPGGALRLFRLAAIAVGLGASGMGLRLGSSIAELRDRLDAAASTTEVGTLAAALGAAHGKASALGVVELLAVVVALALASAARPESPKQEAP